jgi:hypothetical protein
VSANDRDLLQAGGGPVVLLITKGAGDGPGIWDDARAMLVSDMTFRPIVGFIVAVPVLSCTDLEADGTCNTAAAYPLMGAFLATVSPVEDVVAVDDVVVAVDAASENAFPDL